MIYLVSNTPFFDKDVINVSLFEIKFEPICVDLSAFDALIISSKNAINSLRFNNILPAKELYVFAVGKASASAAREFGFERVVTSSKAYGDVLASEFADDLRGKNVLYLRAREVGSNLAEILLQNDVSLTQLIAYTSVLRQDFPPKPAVGSVIIFTSPKNAKNFLQIYGWDHSFKAVAIGESTARALDGICEVTLAKSQEISECVQLAKTLF